MVTAFCAGHDRNFVSARALTVVCSDHIDLRVSDSILSKPDSVALQRAG